MARVLAVWLIVTIGLLTGAGPAAADTPSKAQPSFVATSPVLTFAGDTASTTAQVLNPGPAMTVAFELVLLPTCVTSSTAHGVSLNRYGLTTVPIQFPKASFDASLTGATLLLVPPGLTKASGQACPKPVVLATDAQAPTVPLEGSPAPAQPQPQAIVLTLRRTVPFVKDFRCSALVGVGFGIVCLLILSSYLKNIPDRKFWSERIVAGSAWNFKDSFATNVTAVGGLLAATLLAAGSSSTLLPGIETNRFSLLNVIWGSLAVIAPLVIGLGTSAEKKPAESAEEESPGGAEEESPAGTEEKSPEEAQQASPTPAQPAGPGTYVAFPWLLFALLLMLIAAGGELMTLGYMTSLSATSGATHTAVYVVLSVSGALVGAYVIKTTYTLLVTQDKGKVPHSSLNSYSETALMP